MKENIHPKYQEVLFVDSSTGHKFVIKSTLQPTQTAKHEGKEYPVYPLSVSSYSTHSSQAVISLWIQKGVWINLENVIPL